MTTAGQNPTYANPWVPSRALEILDGVSDKVLDVGGGAAPWHAADHIIDILPFSSSRLAANAWGGVAPCQQEDWPEESYKQFDLCCGKPWPFRDKAFDLGLCSHCVEDLRDPIPVVAEMVRTCRRILIVTPSRLLEQTKGIEHPRYCGLWHHPWIVYSEGRDVVFRRKTPLVNLRGAHVVCPTGKTLSIQNATEVFYGDHLTAREEAYWDESTDLADYVQFIAPYRDRRDLFVSDDRHHAFKFWVWRLRQKLLGVL